MLKKLLTVCTMVLLSAQFAYAQTGSIAGQVTDAETGETIPGANILVVELERGAASDIDGNYRIQNIRPGTYTVTATFVGYRTFRQAVQVNANQTTTLNIEMSMGAIGLMNWLFPVMLLQPSVNLPDRLHLSVLRTLKM
jgi:TonB-dependent starch-binding outer membrane protein SusC